MDGNSNPLPRYPGPKGLEDALSTLLLQHQHEGEFHREGLRADSEYRDLGLARATGGRIGAKLIRAIGPFEKPTGWHWHDMQAHFIYVLKGWIRFRFAGVHEDVTLTAGAALSQPAGVPHNVVARSHDFEVIEITMPGNYGSFDLPESAQFGTTPVSDTSTQGR